MEAECGLIVKSAAGRDKGRFMVVLRTEGEYAYIADGKVRKLAKPKKKKLRHLKLTRSRIDMTDLTDKKLRSVIADFGKVQTETFIPQGGAKLV